MHLSGLFKKISRSKLGAFALLVTTLNPLIAIPPKSSSPAEQITQQTFPPAEQITSYSSNKAGRFEPIEVRQRSDNNNHPQWSYNGGPWINEPPHEHFDHQLRMATVAAKSTFDKLLNNIEQQTRPVCPTFLAPNFTTRQTGAIYSGILAKPNPEDALSMMKASEFHDGAIYQLHDNSVLTQTMLDYFSSVDQIYYRTAKAFNTARKYNPPMDSVERQALDRASSNIGNWRNGWSSRYGDIPMPPHLKPDRAYPEIDPVYYQCGVIMPALRDFIDAAYAKRLSEDFIYDQPPKAFTIDAQDARNKIIHGLGAMMGHDAQLTENETDLILCVEILKEQGNGYTVNSQSLKDLKEAIDQRYTEALEEVERFSANGYTAFDREIKGISQQQKPVVTPSKPLTPAAPKKIEISPENLGF